MSWIVPGGIPAARAAACASSARRRVVPGCDVLALAMTGLPAAMAAAKSPPLALLKANGKLFGPNTTTGPIGPNIERMLFLASIVGRAQAPLLAAAAACRS